MRKRFKLISAITLGLFVFTLSIALAPVAFAQTADGTTGTSTGDSTSTYDPTATTDVSETALFTGVTRSCWDEGTCTLCDILVVFINIADGILKLFAILASVFFVWGAGNMMMSSGNTKMIEKGKGIIRATIIGSIIVLFAWQLMNVVVYVLVSESLFKTEQAKTAAEAKYSPLAWYNVADWCGAASGSSASSSSSSSSSSGSGGETP